MGNKPQQKFDSVVVIGLVLAFTSFVGTFVTAALSAGGVIGMGTVAICLGLAGATGAAGIIAAAIWAKPWLREGIRVALGMILCVVLGGSMYWLYGWIDRNGNRPNEPSAPVPQPAKLEATRNLHTPDQLQPPQDHPPITPQYRSFQPKVVKAHHKALAHTQANRGEVAGTGNQVMNNSVGSIQQYSTGANSPNILGNGNTVNIDAPTAPTLTTEEQSDLASLMSKYAGQPVLVMIHNPAKGSGAFGDALVSALQNAHLQVTSMRGTQFSQYDIPPGVSVTSGDNRMDLVVTLAKFLIVNKLINGKLTVRKESTHPDALQILIAPW